MKRNPYDYGMKAMEISYCWPAKKEPQFRKLLRKLVRATLIRDWEINGAHQGEPSSAYMDRIAKELVP